MKEDKTLWQVIKGYFNAMPDKEDEQETIKQISESVTFHGANLWVLVFAIFIASLGLNVNSTAVIIGAMLISPLMGPIIGMGLAVGISDLKLLKRSIKNYLVSTFISVVTAALYFSITPLNEAQSELLARTTPTLYDVLIALCGGAAGFIALSTKGKGNVIPGVAIATALMPPLCTAGYGLAMGNMSYFFGAFLLFFINTVFIGLATFVGSRMLHFKHVNIVGEESMRKVHRYIVGLVVLTMLPATYMTVQIIKQSFLKNNIRRFVKNELVFKGTQIVSHNSNENEKIINIVAVGKTIDSKAEQEAKEKLSEYQLEGYQLHIYQGAQSDSMLRKSGTFNVSSTGNDANNQKIIEQARLLYDAETLLNEYRKYEVMAEDMKEELKVICPTVETVTLSNVKEIRCDTVLSKRYVLALVKCKENMDYKEREKFRKWLKARTKTDSLRLVINL